MPRRAVAFAVRADYEMGVNALLRPPLVGALALALVAGCRKPKHLPAPAIGAAEALPSSGPVASAGQPATSPRCVPYGPAEGLLAGAALRAGPPTAAPREATRTAGSRAAEGRPTVDPAPPRRAAHRPTEADAASDASSDEEWLPFATEVGEGTAFSGGFAVGVAEQNERATDIGVVTLSEDEKVSRTYHLGTVHGDAEPPRVAARGAVLVAGVLDTTHGARLLRLAKIGSSTTTWGASIPQRRDDSQAFDLAIGSSRGLAVWDEEAPRGGSIQGVAFDIDNPSIVTPPRALTQPTTDADSPRLVVRSNGFWLVYVAHGPDTGASDESPDGGESAGSGEEIGRRWLEAIALDNDGSPTGPALAFSARNGHVLGFDITPAPDDAALVVFHDEDAPSGSAGGEVLGTVLRAGRIDPPTPLSGVDGGVAGSPDLVAGWLALLDLEDTTRLSPIETSRARLSGPLLAEPAIGNGEIVAARSDILLAARPAGREVRLVTLRCVAPAVSFPTASPPSTAAPRPASAGDASEGR